MREELNRLEKIDLYLTGQMNGDDLIDFEKEIKNNPQLKNDIENQQLIIQAVKRQALSAQINAVAKGGGFFNYKWILGGIIFITFLTLLYFKFNPKETQIEAKNVTEIKNTDNKIKIKNIQNKKVKAIDTLMIDTEKAATNLPAQTVLKPKTNLPKKKQKKETNSFEFFDFNGLQCWVKPTVQTFKIDANKTETIEGLQGTLIVIPEHSFIDENGNTVNGKVNFELVEAYDLTDMILYNLTTTSNGSVLETGGMFYTNATQNGKQLKVNPKKPMVVQVPCVKEKPNMMAFESEIDTNGNINWKNPKPLQKWLTKVDLNLLDFLPEGFEDEVYASMPILDFDKADNDVVHQLYYLFGYEKDYIGELKKRQLNKKKGDGRGEFIEDKFVLKPKTKVDCGINPLSIKTLKENQDYANSFVATKEFEERLKELHKLDNGQDMLDIYLNNLDKNLWYSDSIVARKINVKTKSNPKTKGGLVKLSAPNMGRKLNVFDTFFAERKTKVRDGDVYAKALTKYYNSRRKAYKIQAQKVKTNRKVNQEISRLRQLKNQKNLTSQSNVSRVNNYTMAWASFGWANIDAYLHLLEKGSQNVEISCEKSNHKGPLKIYQWLGAISTLTPIIVNQLKGIVKVPKKGTSGAQKMKNTYAIALSHQGEKWFFGYKKYNPYQTNRVNITFIPIDLLQLRQKLREFGGTSPLIKQINQDEKRLKDIQAKRLKQLKESKKQLAKQQKEDAFINRLKQLCFLCYEADKSVIDGVSQNMPEFPGGDDALKKFIDDNYEIPENCKVPLGKNKIYVSFWVDVDGSILNPKIIKGINDCLDTEAIRVINSMPKWSPAYQNNKPIKTEYQFPISVSNL